MTQPAPAEKQRPLASDKPDLREKGGVIAGVPQISDARLFFQMQAFGNCRSSQELIKFLVASEIEGVLYEDLNDPQGVALLTFSQDENHFVTTIRTLLHREPFLSLSPKPEYSLFGRTYSLGYEPNLEDWLLHKPRRRVLDKDWPWAVWYPLRRKGEFSLLPMDQQKQILLAAAVENQLPLQMLNHTQTSWQKLNLGSENFIRPRSLTELHHGANKGKNRSAGKECPNAVENGHHDF